MHGQCVHAQARGQLQWGLPDGYQLQFDTLANELYIGGVYVRLFLKNPKFPLRAPKVTPLLNSCIVLLKGQQQIVGGYGGII